MQTDDLNVCKGGEWARAVSPQPRFPRPLVDRARRRRRTTTTTTTTSKRDKNLTKRNDKARQENKTTRQPKRTKRDVQQPCKCCFSRLGPVPPRRGPSRSRAAVQMGQRTPSKKRRGRTPRLNSTRRGRGRRPATVRSIVKHSSNPIGAVASDPIQPSLCDRSAVRTS